MNGPRATVLSGEVAALEAVGAEQERAGVFFRVLPSVDFASHGPQMAPLAGELEQALAGLGPRSATVPIYSTVTGQVIEGRALDGAYWARNLREPVQFAAAVEGLVAGGHDVFVELSPHPVLTGAVADGLRTG